MSKKKVKTPLAFRMVRFAYGIVQFFFPSSAEKWGFKLFISPIRFPYSERETALLEKATKFTFESPQGTLPAYSWGEGPTILLVHGWSGRATQFRLIIEALVEAGYRALAFDAPAHGKAPGKQTNLIEFAHAAMALEQKEGPIYAMIGHSLGGAVTLLAQNEGKFQIEKRILISTPAMASDIFEKFCQKIGAKIGTANYIRQAVEDRFNLPFEYFTAERQAQSAPDLPTLIIHDKEDKEASYKNADLLIGILKHSELLTTREQGHTRILKDGQVIEKVVSFLQNKPASTSKVELEEMASS